MTTLAWRISRRKSSVSQPERQHQRRPLRLRQQQQPRQLRLRQLRRRQRQRQQLHLRRGRLLHRELGQHHRLAHSTYSRFAARHAEAERRRVRSARLARWQSAHNASRRDAATAEHSAARAESPLYQSICDRAGSPRPAVHLRRHEDHAPDRTRDKKRAEDDWASDSFLQAKVWATGF